MNFQVDDFVAEAVLEYLMEQEEEEAQASFCLGSPCPTATASFCFVLPFNKFLTEI